MACAFPLPAPYAYTCVCPRLLRPHRAAHTTGSPGPRKKRGAGHRSGVSWAADSPQARQRAGDASDDRSWDDSGEYSGGEREYDGSGDLDSDEYGERWPAMSPVKTKKHPGMTEPTFTESTKWGKPALAGPKFSHSSRPWDEKRYRPPTPPYSPPVSSIGKFVSSTGRSSPSASMGSGTRDEWARVYISEAASRASGPPKGIPGPIYNLPGASGKQPLSTKRSAPNMAFRVEKRPGMHELTVSFGAGRRHVTPMREVRKAPPEVFVSPKAILDIPYILGESSMGSQFSRPTSPMVRFGSEPRKTLPRQFEETPGPAGYSLRSTVGSGSCGVLMKQPTMPLPRPKKVNFTTNYASSMGTQALSNKRSAPSFGFGGTTRDQWKRVTMCNESPPRGRGAKGTWGTSDKKFVKAMATVNARPMSKIQP